MTRQFRLLILAVAVGKTTIVISLMGVFDLGRKWENSFPTSGVCLEPEKGNEKTLLFFLFPFPFYTTISLSFSHLQGATINFVIM